MLLSVKLIVAVVILFFVLFLFHFFDLLSGKRFKKKKKFFSYLPHKSTFRIAILAPMQSPMVQEIERGFREKMILESPHDVRCKTFSVDQLSKNVIREQAQIILRGAFDLIFTIGASCSLVMKNECEEQKRDMPIVFADVKNAVELGLIESENFSGNTITGVIRAERNYKKQIDLLTTLKPNCNTALIVYNDACTCLSEDCKKFYMVLDEFGIRGSAISIRNKKELFKVSVYLEKNRDIDTMIILRDHTVTSAIDDLIAVAEKYQVTLYSSDLMTVKNGAAIGFGENDYDYGIVAAHLSRLILEENVHPSEVPIVKLQEDGKLLINARTMKKQGLDITEDLIKFIKHVKLS